MEKFYIIRSDYYGEKWLYAMTDTLADALQFIHEHGDELENTVAVEFCRGCFPFDYVVTKTLFRKVKPSA